MTKRERELDQFLKVVDSVAKSERKDIIDYVNSVNIHECFGGE